MTEYARSTAVYRELRAALGPWSGENGYRRHRGTDAGWIRALENDRDLSFGFRCNPWGSGTTGSSFYGLIQTAPSERSAVVADASTIRQCDISREGDILTFGYYSLDDVRSHAEFLSRHLADIVVRFTQSQCARPTPVPPPPFFGRLVRGGAEGRA